MLPSVDWSDRIEQARTFLRLRIRRTPLEEIPQLADRVGCPVYAKLEFLQLTGSFKLRGAWFALSRLSPAHRRLGVATCSAGNHGLALAYAAAKEGVPATVYLPSDVDPVRCSRIKAYGAEVILAPHRGFDAAEEWAVEDASRRGLTYISAFNDADVIAANGGTLAQEILEDLPDLRALCLPVGGGGLAAGAVLATASQSPAVRLICCQLDRSPGLALSLAAGRAVTRLPPVPTKASGIEGGIGALPFSILQPVGPRVVEVAEAELEQAVRWSLAELGYLIEVSAGAPLAAVLAEKLGEVEGPLVLVLTGRNIGLDWLAQIIQGA